MLKDVLNPIYLITIQVAFLLVYINSKSYLIFNNWRIFNILFLPYLLYLIYYFIRKRYILQIHDNKEFKFSSIVYSICLIFAVSSIFVMSIALFDLSGQIGGFQNLIDSYNIDLVTTIQQSFSKLSSIAVIFAYISPVILWILLHAIIYGEINVLKKKMYWIIIIIQIVVILLFSLIIGARILLINSILPLIILKNKSVKIISRQSMKVIVPIILIAFFVFYAQHLRTKDSYFENMEKKSTNTVLSNYYDKSIENGIFIIQIDEFAFRNPFYWTLRPTLSLPKISKLASVLYNNFVGDIPIKDRIDDFIYIQNLGLNPMYNTLTIFGYMYLDYGMFAPIFIVLIYIMYTEIYFRFKFGKGFYTIIYSLLCICIADQLRTAGIFSVSFLYAICFIVFLKMTNNLNKSKHQIVHRQNMDYKSC